MGIKFFCPNGHKIHVKSFLGGKRALCPKCGVRVLVPAAEDDSRPAARIAGSWEGISADSIETELTTTGKARAVDEADPGNSSVEVMAAIAEPVVSAPSSTREAADGPPAPRDVLSESTSSVWYVRPATGGQFGPASADIMRSWLEQGRIGASSLVWRAGWPEWRTATDVFPQIGELLAPPGVASSVPRIVNQAVNGTAASGALLPVGQVVRSLPVAPSELGLPGSFVGPPPISVARRRKRQNEISLIVSAVLIVLAIILGIILFLFFRNQSASDGLSKALSVPATPSRVA